MNGLQDIHVSNVKEVLSVYAKALHAGDAKLVKNLESAHPDLNARFEQTKAEQK